MLTGIRLLLCIAIRFRSSNRPIKDIARKIILKARCSGHFIRWITPPQVQGSCSDEASINPTYPVKRIINISAIQNPAILNCGIKSKIEAPISSVGIKPASRYAYCLIGAECSMAPMNTPRSRNFINAVYTNNRIINPAHVSINSCFGASSFIS